MKKAAYLMLVVSSLFSCNQKSPVANAKEPNGSSQISEVNQMLDSLNKAAGEANFNAYFNFYADESIFTGTDATERWDKKGFMDFAKPYFDKGQAWNFSALERHVYFDNSGNTAWFDELLDTQMKICRGSGVLIKTGDGWKVKQYILSATVPNPILDSVVKLKAPIEDTLLENLRND